jgi:hypothetical protein
VEGLGHCGTCHTQQGLGLEETALTDQDGRQYVAGGLVENQVANNLCGDAFTGLGGWSEADIVHFLQTGRNTRTAAFGGMTDVVTYSTQYMTEQDLVRSPATSSRFPVWQRNEALVSAGSRIRSCIRRCLGTRSA